MDKTSTHAELQADVMDQINREELWYRYKRWPANVRITGILEYGGGLHITYWKDSEVQYEHFIQDPINVRHHIRNDIRRVVRDDANFQLQ